MRAEPTSYDVPAPLDSISELAAALDLSAYLRGADYRRAKREIEAAGWHGEE